MNTEMMLQVAEAIELEPERFDMGTWLLPSHRTICGTTGCIAGTAVMIHPVHRHGNWLTSNYPTWEKLEVMTSAAADALGLCSYEADDLFTSFCWWVKALWLLGQDSETLRGLDCLDNISPKMAADVLRALAEHKLTFEQVNATDWWNVRRDVNHVGDEEDYEAF